MEKFVLACNLQTGIALSKITLIRFVSNGSADINPLLFSQTVFPYIKIYF
jgi:hypothetical protein